MTCIVGIKDGDKILIGGDSAGVEGLSMWTRADNKVFSVGSFAFGFTSSFRMGQPLRYCFTPPSPRIGQDLFAFMVAEFIPSVRECFENGGWAESKDGVKIGGRFIVGTAGRLFTIMEDFQVAEGLLDFDAVGCGAEIARGAMFATSNLPAADRAQVGLEAAASMSAGVRAPFAWVSV